MPFDESEPEPLTGPDTPNHTTLYAPDTDANYDGTHRLDGTATYEQHYQRLALTNTGVFNGKWANEQIRRRADNLALFDCLVDSLELTAFQKRVGRTVFDQLDLPRLTTAEIDTTLLAIMVAAVVCRPDGRFYHPSRDDNVNDPLFTDLLAEFGYRDGVLHSAYGKVLAEVNF